MASQLNEKEMDQLANSKAWLKLLYYVRDGQGHKNSAFHQSFFLHPEGKSNPILELKEDIIQFRAGENQCVFSLAINKLKNILPIIQRSVYL